MINDHILMLLMMLDYADDAEDVDDAVILMMLMMLMMMIMMMMLMMLMMADDTYHAAADHTDDADYDVVQLLAKVQHPWVDEVYPIWI